MRPSRRGSLSRAASPQNAIPRQRKTPRRRSRRRLGAVAVATTAVNAAGSITRGTGVDRRVGEPTSTRRKSEFRLPRFPGGRRWRRGDAVLTSVRVAERVEAFYSPVVEIFLCVVFIFFRTIPVLSDDPRPIPAQI